ncbi:MAG: SDR family oxidoreductase [Planctomycetes bacterium]|nr:SDR family oxidoreductase [Planctomycetota bacterium]MCB9905610.1 SDR family oxidoreductase [Planctomycetota bacterium]
MDAPLDPSERPAASRWLPAGCFAGKTAVVTGGGTGLGLELSRGLAALGARVAVASRSTEHHAALLAEAAQRSWSVSSHALDVREPAQVEALADELRAELGHVDVLVNNAAGNFVCPAERLSVNAWRSVLGIVLDGTFYCSKSFGRRMIADGGGSILNVVATYAWTGMPGVVHSASAKAGVLAMTKTLAAEWARHGIRVNAIAPGPFESEGAGANLWPDEASRARIERGIPLQRFGTAEEMAAHCLYLLSPASDYVTGECLVVDGGGSLAQPFWDAGTRFSRKRAAREDGES